jgi:hypothetical protein
MLLAALLCAQSGPTFNDVIEALAQPGPEADIVLPEDYFTQSNTVPAGMMQRGGILVAAAGKAREIKNSDRALALAAAAKPWLVNALTGLGGNSVAASQCHYYLGVIAEQYEGDLASAESRYQTAVGLDANNALAKQSLARVQFTRNPPPAN